MADVYVPREDFARGALPHVCFASGVEAEGLAPLRTRRLPGWTFLLLFFGVIPFLIAMAFGTEKLAGHVPATQAVVERYHRHRRVGTSLFVAGAVLAVGGVMADANPLVPAGVLVALAGVAALVKGGMGIPDAKLDETGFWVKLSNVHPDAVAAVRASGRTPEAMPAG